MATIRKHRDKWQVRIRRAGLRPLSKSFAVRKDAMEWGRQMEVRADRAELPTDPKALQRITLAELIVRYRDTVSVKKRGYENERSSLTAFLKHPICSRRLSELRTEDFAAYRDQMLQTIKPTSLKRYLDPIHNLFEVARHEWGLPLRENPLDRLKLTAPSQRRERRLLSGEWQRILQAARLCRNVWIEPIIRLALATGMRRGEILLIQQRHIDRERRTLLIPETKNGHSRMIPLSHEALALLQQFQDDGLLFPISANAFRLAWEKLRQRAGMKDFHFHDLRHEAISRFFELGLTTPEVASISGHRDVRMLFRYAHAAPETLMDKLNSKRAFR
jgi:integrase